MKIKLDDYGIMPTRAHETDAGLDLYTPIDFIVSSNGSAFIDTGVHIQLPKSTTGFVKSKSGLMVKYSIVSGEGVIDEGYTGSVGVKLFNLGTKDVEFKKGDKIAQLVIINIETPKLEQVNKLDESERGDNGFGSTGR